MARSAYEAIESRNAQIVEILDKNHEVSNFIAAVLHHLVAYGLDKGVRYEDIRLDDPFVTNEGYLQARIKSKLEL